jgi:hypothetical protein
MTVPTPESLELVERLFASLDYRTLGGIYCHEEGDDFWDERRDDVVRAGLQWAGALGARLGSGRSLYVGAGVAELPALIVETTDLDREVHIATLNAPECDSLNQSLAALGLSDRIHFHFRDAGAVLREDAFDHLSLVSVLNDPEQYPTVSDVSYGRLHPVFLDLSLFETERKRLRTLVESLLDALQLPAWVTTTVEEVPWIMAAAEGRGLQVEADEDVIESAVVGDPIGFLRIVQP